MPYPHEHAARINDPGKYKSFRREKNKFGIGIDAIWGITFDGNAELQAVRFDKSKHSMEQVHKWLKDHNQHAISIEPASTENMGETDLADLYLDDEFEDVNGIEVLNIFPNTKKIKFTPELFDELINNFNEFKNEKSPYAKIDHTSQQAVLKALTGKLYEEGTELPSLGYAKRMYHNGKSLFADFTKVPKKLKEIIFGGKVFKSISPEVNFNFRDTGKKIITAFALTNNPSQKHIMDIHMHENTTDESLMGGLDGTAICFSGDINITGESVMADKDEQKNIATDVKLSDEAIQTFSEKIISGIAGIFKKDEKKKIDENTGGDKTEVVALSEYKALESKYSGLSKDVEDLKHLLIKREDEHKKFSEQVKSLETKTRKEQAEAICKQAMLDGVPKVVIDYFRPVFLSEVGTEVITLSEKIEDKVVEIKKSMSDMIQGFFKVYPNKISFSDITRTNLNEPGEVDKDTKQLSEVEKRKGEILAANPGMPQIEALEKAILEVSTKKEGV